jgi:hypothetical protein
MRHADKFSTPREAFKSGFNFGHTDGVMRLKGTYIIHLTDADTGAVIDHREQSNIVTLDGGILVAILLASGANPTSIYQGGLTMLAVGTGATGALLNPDVPDPRQRRLNTEIARKPFALPIQFRSSTGAAVSYPTNVVDFTATFGASEAVGPLNEMGLIRAGSTNPLVTNPVPATFPTYDPTINLNPTPAAPLDILANYTTFSVVSKPANSLLTITWRLTT